MAENKNTAYDFSLFEPSEKERGERKKKDNIIKSWNELVTTASCYAGYKRTDYGPDFVIRMNQHWDKMSENINNL